MSRFFKPTGCILLLLLAAPIYGQPAPTPLPPDTKPVITAPTVKSISVGERTQLDLSFAGADFVSYQALGCEGFEIDRLYGTDPSKISLKFSATSSGIYYVLATASNKGGISTAVVTLSVRPYVAPPTPTPPVPVDPIVPIPVPPADPLTPTLAAAWAKETPADKAKILDLKNLYLQSITLADDPKLTTGKMLFDLMHAARVATVKDALPNIRAILTTELDKTLPTTTAAPLDAPTRATAKALFTRLGGLLNQLK